MYKPVLFDDGRESSEKREVSTLEYTPFEYDDLFLPTYEMTANGKVEIKATMAQLGYKWNILFDPTAKK